jgi:hypothetical protein
VIHAAVDSLDSGPVIFSPNELNTFVSLDNDANLSNTSIQGQINLIYLFFALMKFLLNSKITVQLTYFQLYRRLLRNTGRFKLLFSVMREVT